MSILPRKLPDQLQPDSLALNSFWSHKSQRIRKSIDKGSIHVFFLIGCKQRYTLIALNRLQQIVCVPIRKAIMQVSDFCRLAEERIRLVEEKDHAAILGRIEHPRQVLLRFADVLANYSLKIKAIEVYLQMFR